MTIGSELSSLGVTVEEYDLTDQIGLPFWHATMLDKNCFPVAGGFGPNRTLSRKIAYSEYLERTKVYELKHGSKEVIEAWGLDLIPTACGFAAGFDKRNTIIRSIGEALERWAMSKWIDDHYYLDPVESVDLSELDIPTRWFAKQFDEVKFYRKKFFVPFGNQICPFYIGVTLGLKGDGIYPGSSSKFEADKVWHHSLLESFRHLSIVKNGRETNRFPDNKVRFFAKNLKVAEEQIAKADKKDWPLPQIKLHRNQYFQERKYHLARTIISGWESWHKGPIERFLY